MAAHKMDAVLASLEQAADKLGIKVSYEALAEVAYGGGLCKVKGSYRVIIDKRATVGERVSTLARALASFDTDGVHMTPSARELVDELTALTRASDPAAQARA
jgi:hypothetical protein